jgi:RNA-binding protein
MNLTGKQKRFLRAHGHGLKPTVWIGKLGVELTVLTQLDWVLTSQELVKVRVLESCPLSRNECAAVLARESGAGVAQILGHTILLYRPHPQHPELELPRARRPDELDIEEDDL